MAWDCVNNNPNTAYYSADYGYIGYPFDTDDEMPDFMILIDGDTEVRYARVDDVDAKAVISRCIDCLGHGNPSDETMAVNILKYALLQSNASGYHRGYIDGSGAGGK